MSTNIVTDFREGLKRGELLLQKCEDCQKLNMYPRYACPHCQSENLGWQAANGRGIIHSYTVLRTGPPEGFEKDIPYALAVVKLEEGVQLLARLAPDSTGDWGEYSCDMAVEFQAVDPKEIEEKPCAWFTKAR